MVREKLQKEDLVIETRDVSLRALLMRPEKARSLVVFAPDAGNDRHGDSNRYVAGKLADAGFAALLPELLTEDEQRIDTFTERLRFEVPLLAGRLDSIMEWVLHDERTAGLDVAYFGVGVGAAAALVAALQKPELVYTVACRSGRVDLAWDILPEIKPPVLLIVGGRDGAIKQINEEAVNMLKVEHKLVVVPEASSSFTERRELDTVVRRLRHWLSHRMQGTATVYPVTTI